MRLQFSKLFILRVKKRISILHNYSVKILIEGIIIILAIIIPGGLIAYFAWKAYKHAKRSLPCSGREGSIEGDIEGMERAFPSLKESLNRRGPVPLDPYYRQP